MYKCEPVLKYIKHTTNTTHTLTFLKSNYKYKRRFFKNVPTVQAIGEKRQQAKLIAIDEAEGERKQKQNRNQNTKNNLKTYAIYQIIATNHIIYEIKSIIKLFILLIGNILTESTCYHNKSSHCSKKFCNGANVALAQSFKVLESFDDDTSHQRLNYDKVLSVQWQKAMVHQWGRERQRRVVQIANVAFNQNKLCNNNCCHCNDSNWQDLSPVAMQLSTKATTMSIQQEHQQQHTLSAAASYTSNGRINLLTTLVAILFMALAFNAPPLVDAGACWRSIQSNGKCSEIYLRNSTKAECCRYPELYYTDRDVTEVEFFFATTVGDGMTCSPCALSCKSMQCGWNKKCVKRKDRPKCVCAPECGAAKRRRQQAEQQKIFRGHELHSEQLLTNRHIVLGGGTTSGVEVSAKMASGSTLPFLGDDKSPRDIRSLSSEITNINLGVEHQTQNQNQRKMITMQSQSQEKHQLNKHLNEIKQKTGRLFIMANVERESEKPHIQRRLQIFSNVRTNRRHRKKYRNRENDYEHNYDDEGDDNDDDDDDEKENKDDVRMQAGADDRNEDGDVGDWFDDLSTSNQRRSSLDSTRTKTITATSLGIRKRLNSSSRHKTNKSLTQNNNNQQKRSRQQKENEMDFGKRLPQNSNNNFAIIKRLPTPSQARRHENIPNHDELLLGVVDMANGGNNNNYNFEGGSKHNERHRHQQHQRKRKHHQLQKQQQHLLELEQQQQIDLQHQTPRVQHTKHKNLKDHNNNKNNSNVTKNFRTRTSSISMTTSSQPTHTTTTTTTLLPMTIDLQTTQKTATETATTPVNSVIMSPSFDDRLLDHGSYLAKSSSSSSSSSTAINTQKHSASMTESFFGEGVSADVGKSSLNSDDSALLDGINNKFNVYGFPNRQFEVAVENFHGPHPVCGTDGRTYNTECQLKKRACRTNNPSLAVAYRGHCRTSCNGVKCLNDQTCVEDQYSIPHCIVCKINCPDDDVAAMAGRPIDPSRAVCGVDGKTYRSICDINRMICVSGRSIAIAYPGPCRDDRPFCSEINCGHKHTCLVDLLTHEPRCVSCSYKCARKRRPTSLRFEEGKICGVNNRTYNSWCELRRDSCNTGFLIDIKMAGECH
ncbi:uncharacterized protein Fs [Eurosta solidaginis]|uniref:uncharacterized protein Fs n=1 Tax=Eurosta solidaginis TaxID=178769 RepID=UPI0035314F9D